MRDKLVDVLKWYTNTDRAQPAADAIIAALPSMVPPLVWKEYPINGDPVLATAVTRFGSYFICDDTDDFTGLYGEFISQKDAEWFGTVRSKRFVLFLNIHENDHTKLYHFAETHNVRNVMAALGITSGETT